MMELIIAHLLLTNYIVNLNGTINSTWLASNTVTGFINNTNNGVSGYEGWAFALIPFIIILIGASYTGNPTGGLIFAAFVGAGVTLLETQIITYATINLQLYTFIAVLILGVFALLLTGVDRPYS